MTIQAIENNTKVIVPSGVVGIVQVTRRERKLIDSGKLDEVDVGMPNGLTTRFMLVDLTEIASESLLEELDMNIQQIADRQFDWVERMGWHNKKRLEYLALIGSEVGEAVNECRGLTPTDNYAEELTDILLRTLDLMVVEKINIIQSIQAKMDKNEVNGTSGKLV